jgi:hypothetical protein
VDELKMPPLNPIGEQMAESDPAFVQTCLKRLDIVRGLGEVKAGPSRFSLNSTFGPVFRVDFTINGDRVPGYVNRLMCWTNPDDGKMVTNYAIGQKTAPLF